MDVCASDIKNAYLQSPSSERHYIICGKEFGVEHEGKVAVIVRALYGGKCAGMDYWKHLRTCMKFLGFEPCKADPDVWLRVARRPDNSEYYEMVLLYVDDCLAISLDPERILCKEIGKYFVMKEDSIGPPSIYLGGKCTKVKNEYGTEYWQFSSSQYVQNACKTVSEYLKELNRDLAPEARKFFMPKKAPTPLSTGFRPEIDDSPVLEPELASYYLTLIGILRWINELGRVEATTEISMMSSCMAMPRENHLKQLIHFFAYLRDKHNAVLEFDPTPRTIDMNDFPRQDWSHTVYCNGQGECKEEIPSNLPKPLGKEFQMYVQVDSDHAGCMATRRSRTGFLVWLNSSLIYLSSKKQTTIETSSFGSEFMALKTCTEYVRGLRFKLRAMGIPVTQCTYIHGDNQSVLVNSSQPDSQLKKKSNSIAYHHVREGCALDEWKCAYISTNDNAANMMSKTDWLSPWI